jgi:hypothetical protein
LGHRIDLPIDASQAGHDEDAALQVRGVAHGCDRDIDLRPRLRERW